MALTVVNNAASKYRSAVTAKDTADLATLMATVFTRATPIPVIPVVGGPNVAVRASFTNPGDTVGVTPIALRVDPSGVSVLGVGSELTLGAGAVAAQDGAGKTFSETAILSPLGAGGAGNFAGGPVTHLAFLCSTAPTGAAACDFYAWSWS
jgi:hypothetical protein